MDKSEAFFNCRKLNELLEDDPIALRNGLKGKLLEDYSAIVRSEMELLSQIKGEVLSAPDLGSII